MKRPLETHQAEIVSLSPCVSPCPGTWGPWKPDQPMAKQCPLHVGDENRHQRQELQCDSHCHKYSLKGLLQACPQSLSGSHEVFCHRHCVHGLPSVSGLGRRTLAWRHTHMAVNAPAVGSQDPRVHPGMPWPCTVDPSQSHSSTQRTCWTPGCNLGPLSSLTMCWAHWSDYPGPLGLWLVPRGTGPGWSSSTWSVWLLNGQLFPAKPVLPVGF